MFLLTVHWERPHEWLRTTCVPVTSSDPKSYPLASHSNLNKGEDIIGKIPETATETFALLIGNNEYKHISSLHECVIKISNILKKYLQNSGLQLSGSRPTHPFEFVWRACTCTLKCSKIFKFAVPELHKGTWRSAPWFLRLMYCQPHYVGSCR